jgi:LacI family transcriptional regulator
VPQDVGVIGVFDQTEYSTLNAPTITSVPLNLRAHGRAAMETLLRIIRNDDPFTGTRMVTPLLPVVRQSTAHCRCDDPLVNQASQFIHDHAGKLLNVGDVADHFEVNRRTLERRFRQAVGTSPYQRIQDARIELARRLIIESDRPLAEIALDTGFRYVSNLSQAIKKHTGHSPTELRQQYR